MSQLPKDRIIKIEFEFLLPVSATQDEIAEWVSFETGSGSMSCANPLCDNELEFWGKRPVLTDTYLQGRTIESNRRQIPVGITTVDVQYIREPVIS